MLLRHERNTCLHEAGMGTEGHARTDPYLLIDSYLHIKKVARAECIDRLFARLVKING